MVHAVCLYAELVCDVSHQMQQTRGGSRILCQVARYLGFKSGTEFRYRSVFKKKKFQLDLNFGPRGSRPDTLPAHVYCNVTKFD